MESNANNRIRERIEVFQAVLLMPEIANDLKELYKSRIEALEAEIETNPGLE